jgi:hypothetical protein
MEARLMSLSTLRLAAAAAVLAVTAGAAGATIVSPVPNPIPNGSSWDLVGTFDTPFGWVRDTLVTDFQFLSGSLTPQGLEATYSANLSQMGYSAPTGGDPLGANFLSTDDFEIFIGNGFNPLTNYLGTFPETIESATFIGTVAGNAVVDELDPLRTSTGSVTISPAAGGEFLIDNRATIYGVYTINGGVPITVPVALTVGTPEASTWAMMLLGLASLGFAGYRRTTRLA